MSDSWPIAACQSLIALLTALFLVGCAAIGPQTVPRDRFDYNKAVSDFWKQQTLLNIVKLRYADIPLFMEVASIVSGYTLENSVSLTGTLVEGGALPSLIDAGSAGDDLRRIIDIRSSEEKLYNAFVAVNFWDHWFWIDDRDFKSKRTFAYLKLLFSLTESGGKEGLPLVTIPAG